MSETNELHVMGPDEVVESELKHVTTAIDAAVLQLATYPSGDWVRAAGPISEVESRWSKFLHRTQGESAYSGFNLDKLQIDSQLTQVLNEMRHLNSDPPEWPQLIRIMTLYHSVRRIASDALLQMEHRRHSEAVSQAYSQCQAVSDKLLNYQLAVAVAVVIFVVVGGFGIWRWFTH